MRLSSNKAHYWKCILIRDLADQATEQYVARTPPEVLCFVPTPPDRNSVDPGWLLLMFIPFRLPWQRLETTWAFRVAEDPAKTLSQI